MQINLGAQWESFIAERVKNGQYPSADDVVQDGLRLLEVAEQLRGDVLRTQLEEGLAELDRGDCLELDRAGMKRYLEEVDRRGMERLASGATQKSP